MRIFSSVRLRLLFLSCRNIVRRALRDLCCPYSSLQLISKLSQSVRVHFVTRTYLTICNKLYTLKKLKTVVIIITAVTGMKEWSKVVWKTKIRTPVDV